MIFVLKLKRGVIVSYGDAAALLFLTDTESEVLERAQLGFTVVNERLQLSLPKLNANKTNHIEVSIRKLLPMLILVNSHA